MAEKDRLKKDRLKNDKLIKVRPGKEQPEKKILEKINQVHLVGIGGISMSAIAGFLLERGIKVTGSDLKINDKIKMLQNRGVEVFRGHRAENLGEAGLLIYSSAIPADNVELEEARRRGIIIMQRAEMLALLTLNKRLVAVSGTHGKTTTTGMLAAIFLAAGRDPDVMVGGDLDLIQGNYRTGGGNYFLTEADESDGSLLYFSPETAVITNIEPEHMDYYQNKKELVSTMVEFLAGTGGTNKTKKTKRKKREGSAVLCLEDVMIRKQLLPALGKKCPGLELITYGFGRGELQARNTVREGYASRFELVFQGESKGSFQLAVPGNHNILNALAAAAAANRAGINWEEISRGLRGFSGIKRRFEIKGEVRGITVIDDYAHHPTEIKTLFSTAVELGYQRIVTVFQPHRYTRTEKLWQDFVRVLSRAPGPLLLTEIYSAHQEPIPGITSSNLLTDIKRRIKKAKHQLIDRDDQQHCKRSRTGEGRGDEIDSPGPGLANSEDLTVRSGEEEADPAGVVENENAKSERKTAGISSGEKQEKIYLTPNRDEAVKKLVKIVKPGDLVLTAGAGDVYRIGENFLAKLQEFDN